MPHAPCARSKVREVVTCRCVWSFVVLFLSCRVMCCCGVDLSCRVLCCSCCVFVCVTCVVVVLFLSCRVLCCSCCVFVCVTCLFLHLSLYG